MAITKVWVSVCAGGAFKTVWDPKGKTWFVPVFSSHESATKFWHGKTEDRYSWGIQQVEVNKIEGRNGQEDS